MPSSRSVRKMRTAISPRLATRTFEKSVMSGVFSPSHEPSRSADRRARALRAARRAAVRLGAAEQRVLGDRALLRRYGHGLVRRPDRAAPRHDLVAGLAPRPDRR